MSLTVKQVEKIIREAAPGATADGDGLYLKITPAGNASWQYRYQINGKRRMMGLGACSVVSLAEARDKAADARKQVKKGIDPLEAKAAEETEQRHKAGRLVVTFADAAKEYIDGKAPGWSNPKHVDQWRNTLATYCAKFSSKPVASVTIDDAEAALRPIWIEKTETATRVLTRIVSVMSYAFDKGWREDDDAETWAPRLRRRLPLLPKKTIRTKHHPALPYEQMNAFMQALRHSEAMGSRALEFGILCASRSGEVREARWQEIDLDAGIWTIPGARMKASVEHRVPLSSQALRLLANIKPAEVEPTAFVFPGSKPGKALSDMTLTAFIRRQNEKSIIWKDDNGEAITQHGFRSTFRDWCSEMTAYPRDVAEMALAHTIGNKVEAAYRRGDLFEKRRRLMQDWADFCDLKASGEVIPIRSNAAA